MLTTPVPSGELIVVTSLDGIEDVFSCMVEKPLPGFQMSPEVNIDESLLILAGLMVKIDPTFKFNDVSGRTKPGSDIYPHIDNSYVQSMAGIAVHENISGIGEVILQLVAPTVSSDDEITPEVFVGPALRGNIQPGTKTVFSERIFSQEYGVIIGASRHKFTTLGGGLGRSWFRYTYSGGSRSVW